MGSCWKPSTQTCAQRPQRLAVRSQDPENERPSPAWLVAAFGRAGRQGEGAGGSCSVLFPQRETRTGVSMCPKVGGARQIQGRAGPMAHVMLKGILTSWGVEGCAHSGVVAVQGHAHHCLAHGLSSGQV